MSFFETIREEAQKRQLRFLVIGGLAINHYGYSRETGDLDLLIRRLDRQEWLTLLSALGYSTYHDGGSFIQLSQPKENAWPIDLMLINDRTFDPIFATSLEANFYGVKMSVPALEHLLALKLHALKNTRMQRFLKDFLDVENLILINQLDVKSKKIRELFDKYGTQDLYEKISRSIAGDR